MQKAIAKQILEEEGPNLPPEFFARLELEIQASETEDARKRAAEFADRLNQKLDRLIAAGAMKKEDADDYRPSMTLD